MRWDMLGHGGMVAGDLLGLTPPRGSRAGAELLGLKKLNYKCQELPRVIKSFPAPAPSNAAHLERRLFHSCS